MQLLQEYSHLQVKKKHTVKTVKTNQIYNIKQEKKDLLSQISSTTVWFHCDSFVIAKVKSVADSPSKKVKLELSGPPSSYFVAFSQAVQFFHTGQAIIE